jgi:hypothetical protein
MKAFGDVHSGDRVPCVGMKNMEHRHGVRHMVKAKVDKSADMHMQGTKGRVTRGS